ncbi:hypothetical protein ACF0H5_004895 [Mactra antiquata]
MAIDEIVKEIMSSDQNTVVTYHDDGSKKQGSGSFSVQGMTVNGKYRSLLTFPIASESRRNIADLKLAVLKIMEAASGYTSKEIYEKLDFVITDQTAHNLGIEEKLSESLDSAYTPDHLFCNVHPSLMFNRVITKQWSEIETAIGPDKKYSSFLVNATSNKSSVTEQALDCTTRLINHDFDHKSWNKATEFDSHIAPRKNNFVSQERFRQNRYDDNICIALNKTTEELHNEVVKVLSMLLPKLAKGFQNQKGEIFGLGDKGTTDYSLSEMNREKLDKAPIHNVTAERSVGFINYELQRRGSKQLASASAVQVKSKSADLIEKQPSGTYAKYKQLVKGCGKIPEIMTEWNKKQEELLKQGLEKKKIANVVVGVKLFVTQLTPLKFNDY